MTTTPLRCLVVVPTYNEAETIESFLRDVLDATRFLDARVLVVDDSSPDGTGDLVRAHDAFGVRVELLSRSVKDGLGAAYRAGFRWAVERGYDVVVQVDADGSHPVERIPALVAALGDHDLVIGSRYVAGGTTRNWPLRRRMLSRAANTYVRLVLGLRTHDTTAGFRAWRSMSLVDLGVLETRSSGYAFQIENSWRAERAGARMVELPITFTERRAGASKMSGEVALEALVRVASWRARELREVLTFLLVGGAGYVVDVLTFNLLEAQPGHPGLDPTVSKVVAVAAAMVVTYLGNRMLTWRHQGHARRRREISLFVLFNLIGLGISVALLALTHDVLGLTSRLADNLSANVLGLALGTAFRYWSYRRFVFAPTADPSPAPVRAGGLTVSAGPRGNPR